VSDFVLDVSLTLQWFLEDESNRQYGLDVIASLSHQSAIVPGLWFYEVGNGPLMACRRKRISWSQIEGFLARLAKLPILSANESPNEVLELPSLAQKHTLTNYDAAYLALALRRKLPLATADSALIRAAASAGVEIFGKNQTLTP